MSIVPINLIPITMVIAVNIDKIILNLSAFIPVAFGSFIFSLGDFATISQAGGSTIILYIISMIFAFIFTYLALEFIFKKFSIKHYKYFAIYMVFIGVLTISYYVIFVK